jgi:hypothetical protein
MSKVFQGVGIVSGWLFSLVTEALANEPTAGAPDYSGISYMYYTMIALILAYGVYDTFLKKS